MSLLLLAVWVRGTVCIWKGLGQDIFRVKKAKEKNPEEGTVEEMP